MLQQPHCMLCSLSSFRGEWQMNHKYNLIFCGGKIVRVVKEVKCSFNGLFHYKTDYFKLFNRKCRCDWSDIVLYMLWECWSMNMFLKVNLWIYDNLFIKKHLIVTFDWIGQCRGCDSTKSCATLLLVLRFLENDISAILSSSIPPPSYSPVKCNALNWSVVSQNSGTSGSFLDWLKFFSIALVELTTCN